MADRIRPFTKEDGEPAAHLVHRAIHEGASKAYSPQQCAAWSPEPRSGQAFNDRIHGQVALVGEDAHGLTGIFTLTEHGLLDLAFVRPDKMGTGTAGALHDAIVEVARTTGLSALTVEASHLARRFLQKRGWSVVETQTVTPNGVAMENHRMTLKL